MSKSRQTPEAGTPARPLVLKTSRTLALLVESWDQAREAKRKEWEDIDHQQPYEAFASGEPCRACRRALLAAPAPGDEADIDAVIDSDNAAFRSEHEACSMGFWRIEDRRADHCHLCCPLPPLGPRQREELRKILSRPVLHNYAWQVELTCGHVEIVSSGIPDHAQATTRCPGCAVTRGVVTATRVDDQTVGDADATDVDDAVPLYQRLTDGQWSRIKRILHADDAPRRGRPRADARAVADAILHRAYTGIAWRDLPPEFGPWQTAARRYRQLAADGSWDAALRALSDSDRVEPIDNDPPA